MFEVLVQEHSAMLVSYLVALVGSITCLFTSLTLVPALMARPDESTAESTE